MWCAIAKQSLAILPTVEEDRVLAAAAAVQTQGYDQTHEPLRAKSCQVFPNEANQIALPAGATAACAKLMNQGADLMLHGSQCSMRGPYGQRCHLRLHVSCM